MVCDVRRRMAIFAVCVVMSGCSDRRTGESSTSSVETAATAPPFAGKIVLEGGPAIDEGSWATLAVRTDRIPIPPPARFEWDFGDGAVEEGGAEMRHWYQQDGEHVVRARAKNAPALVAEASGVVHVRNVPPKIDLGGATDWVPNKELSIEAAIVDPGYDTFVAKIEWGDGSSESIDLHSKAFRASHTYATSGAFDVKVELRDDAGAATTASKHVDVFAHPMLFVRSDVPTWTAVGTKIEGRVSATDLDGSNVPVSLANAPSGMTLSSNGWLTWTPSAQDVGEKTFSVVANDGVTSKTTQLSIRVSGVTVEGSTKISAAQGGVIEVTNAASPLRGARLEVPAGALAADTTLAIGSVTTPLASGALASVELMPSGTVFRAPVKLTLPYDRSKLGELSEDAIEIATYEMRPLHVRGPVRLPLESAVDKASQRVSAAITHFSPYEVISNTGVRRKIRTNNGKGVFTIEWDAGGPDAAPRDKNYTPEPGAPYATDGIPKFIQDVARYLEYAAVFFRPTYSVDGADTPGYRVLVQVPDRAERFVIGQAFVQEPLIVLSPDMRSYDFVQAVTAHELFHHCEFATFGDTPAERVRPFAALDAKLPGFYGLLDASANTMAIEAMFGAATRAVLTTEDYLYETRISGRDRKGYDAFAPFLYMRGHQGADVMLHMWGTQKRDVATSNLEDASAEDYVHRVLPSLARDKPRLWHDFAFAFQYSRDPNWIPFIRKDKILRSGSLLTYVKSRAFITSANDLTGHEREKPAAQTDTPPAELESLPTLVKKPVLRAGRIASFALRPQCNVYHPSADCKARMELSTADQQLVLRPTMTDKITGAVYRMSVFPNDPDNGIPIFVRHFTKSDGDVKISLSSLGNYDEIVVTFAADPTAGRDDSVSLQAFFSSAAACEVSLTKSFGCVKKLNGDVACWGSNFYGQMGRGFVQESTYHDPYAAAPLALVPDVANVRSLSHSPNGYSMCAVQSDGVTKCWGLNRNAQLLNGSTEFYQPSPVAASDAYSRVSISDETGCGVTPAGRILCAGVYSGRVWGALGRPYPLVDDPAIPGEVLGITTAVDVMSAGTYSCAVVGTDSVTCWGSCGGWGTTDINPDGTCTFQPTPVPMRLSPGGGERINARVQLAMSDRDSTCALKTDGTVWCAGRNSQPRPNEFEGAGWLGTGSTKEFVSTPEQVLGLPKAVSIGASATHRCVVGVDGSVWCWRSYRPPYVAVQIPIPGEAVQISLGAIEANATGNGACVVTRDNKVMCFGFPAFSYPGDPLPPYFTAPYVKLDCAK